MDALTTFEVRVLEETGSIDMAIRGRDFITECIDAGIITADDLPWIDIHR